MAFEPTRIARTAAAFVALAAVVSGSTPADAKRPGVTFSAAYASYPSARYGALSSSACTAELARRNIAFTSVANAPGVLAPVRVPQGINGIVVRTEAPANARATSPYDVFDCRLVLAVADFGRILAAHDIDEVVMYSAWRPPDKNWPAGKLGTRHPGGLAIDAARFGKRLHAGQTHKQWLDVLKDFHGALGKPVCGPDAVPPAPATPEARELRSIVCEASDQHLFTVMLTPNYNTAHRNHFHLEVTPDAKWTLVR